jgi:hypothetical protein
MGNLRFSEGRAALVLAVHHQPSAKEYCRAQLIWPCTLLYLAQGTMVFIARGKRAGDLRPLSVRLSIPPRQLADLVLVRLARGPQFGSSTTERRV